MIFFLPTATGTNTTATIITYCETAFLKYFTRGRVSEVEFVD